MSMIPEPSPAAREPDAVTIARIEGKIDLLIQSVGGLHDDSKDHENRLRTVEAALPNYVTAEQLGRARTALQGWLMLLAAAMTAAIALVALVVK